MSNKVSVDSENQKGQCPAVPLTSQGSMGLIVLQEWWGINEAILKQAKVIADQGDFYTLVPDLYRGEVTEDYEHAGHLMKTLDWEGAVLDVQGCARYLRQQGCKKVGVMGFCMGGALSLAAAVKVPEIDAAAPFYGIPDDKLADISTIKIPLQCHFGELDEIAGFSDLAAQQKLKEKLTSGGVPFQFHAYPGARHAFCDHSFRKYNREACETSFKRTAEFFRKHLASDQS